MELKVSSISQKQNGWIYKKLVFQTFFVNMIKILENKPNKLSLNGWEALYVCDWP